MLERSRGALVDFLTRSIGTRKGDFCHVLVFDQGCTNVEAVSGDDVDDAGWEPGFFDKVHEFERGGGGELGWFRDDGVAGG